jgi:hypothetical protein
MLAGAGGMRAGALAQFRGAIMSISASAQECHARAAAVVAARSPKAQDFMKPLYHYTDSDGLIGIVTSKYLRATDSRFVNDPLELEYGRGLFKEVLGQFGVPPHVVRMISEGILPMSVYVASFCEDGDLLSQWRAYSSDGLGYAVGFDPSASWMGGGVEASIVRVVYDRMEQLELLNHVIDPVLDALLSWNGEGPPPNEVSQIRGVVDPLLPMFKNPGFDQEHEWRAVVHLDRPRNYRAARFGVTPYVELEAADGLGLPITNLVLGPRIEPRRGAFAVTHLLGDNEFLVTDSPFEPPPTTKERLVVVRASSTPYA